MSSLSIFSKKGHNEKMKELSVAELKVILAQLVNGRISVSDKNRRKKIRVIKAHLTARKCAEQTLLGQPVIGYTVMHGTYRQPTTQDFLR